MSTVRLIDALASRPGRVARVLTAGLLGLSLAVLAQSVSEKDVDAAAAAAKQTEASLKDAKASLAKAQKAQAKSQDIVKDLQDDLAALRAKLAKASDKDKVKLTTSVQKTSEQLAAATADNGKAQATAAAAQTSVATLQAQADQARAKVDTLRAQAKTAAAQQDKAADAAKAAKAQAEAAAKQAKADEAKRADAADAAAKAARAQEAKRTEALAAEKERAAKAVKDAEAKAKAEAASKKEQEEKLLAETKDADKEIAKAEKKVANAREDADAARKAFEKEQAAAEQAKAIVRQRSSDLVNAVDPNARTAAATALKRAESDATSQAADVQKAQEKVTKAQQELAAEQKAVADAQSRAATLKANSAQILAARKRAAEAEAAAEAARAQEAKRAEALAAEQKRLAKQQEEAAAVAAKAKKAAEAKAEAAAKAARAEEAKRTEALAAEQKRLAKQQKEAESKAKADAEAAAKAAKAQEAKRPEAAAVVAVAAPVAAPAPALVAAAPAAQPAAVAAPVAKASASDAEAKKLAEQEKKLAEKRAKDAAQAQTRVQKAGEGDARARAKVALEQATRTEEEAVLKARHTTDMRQAQEDQMLAKIRPFTEARDAADNDMQRHKVAAEESRKQAEVAGQNRAKALEKIEATKKSEADTLSSALSETDSQKRATVLGQALQFVEERKKAESEATAFTTTEQQARNRITDELSAATAAQAELENATRKENLAKAAAETPELAAARKTEADALAVAKSATETRQQAEAEAAKYGIVIPRKAVRELAPGEVGPGNAGPWTVKEISDEPSLQGGQKLQTPDAVAGDVAAAGKRLTFDVPMISGDKEIVEKLPAWKEWADHVTFNPVSPEEINEFHGKLTKALQEEGYVFAKVVFPTRIWSYGIFLAKVDCGPLGTITVKGNRYYSAKQVISSLQRQDGERFNYARIHGDLFDLNTQPDIAINTKLKPVMQDGRRVINAELEVDDSLPIHGAVEVSNTGTDATDDWRIRSTLQHLNLTKHYDVLTADWITTPDISEVNAWSAGYYLPVGDAYSLSLFGGYSTSSMENVLPLLDIRGKGHFFGGQVTKTLQDTNKYRLQLSGGWLFQHSETEHELDGMNLEDRKIDMSMPQVTLGYASKTFDKLGGRNFLSNTVMGNFAGQYGSSESEVFNSESEPYADGDFAIDRVQVARLQRFFSGEDAPGKWSLFMKADGQFTSDTLPPDMRKAVGGANTVRGYTESEAAGDQVIAATLELRTPLFHNFIPGIKKSDEFLEANPEAWQRHRLQFIAFTDYAYTDINTPRAGETSGDTFMSGGVGLRMGLTKYSQMTLDYGYPFEKTTENTPSSGRLHMSLQLQF